MDGLAGQLKADLEHRHDVKAIIGIDGIDGAGKSTLAGRLEKALGGVVISLDSYGPADTGHYVPSLKISDIQRAIREADRTVIIEGLCLLAAAQKCQFHMDRVIYVQRLDSWGDWIDAEECTPGSGAEALIRKLSATVMRIREVCGESVGHKPDEGLTDFRKEIIRYHGQFLPSDAASYIFRRIVTD